jgi:hypothetical protein
MSLLQECLKIGFFTQDSIDVWIPMKSKAKHAGIMLMVLVCQPAIMSLSMKTDHTEKDYIADISKDTSPLILKEMYHEQASDYQSEDVLVDSSQSIPCHRYLPSLIKSVEWQGSSLPGREVGVALGITKPGKLDYLARKVADFVGWQDTEEASSLSAADIQDVFPAALGWDWKNQEVIPSIWASVEDLEANGWKIIRESTPPPLPPKLP